MTPATPRIVVAGGGPAGMAAAAAAARAGASVLLCEEHPRLGGQLRYRAQPVEIGPGAPAERPDRLATRLVSAVKAAGVDVRASALVAGWYDGAIVIVEPGRSWTLSPELLIVAAGSTDLPFPFAGASYPGVFSRRAVQILLNQHRVRPGRRFAIIGTGPEADELAVDIMIAGGEVVWSGVVPAPMLRARGRDGVRGLAVGDDLVELDVIAIAVGRQPDAALATMAGASLAFSPELGGWAPVTDARLRCPGTPVIVAGDAAGIGGVGAALAEGHLAGVAAAAALGLAADEDVDQAVMVGGSELASRLAARAGLTAAYRQPYA